VLASGRNPIDARKTTKAAYSKQITFGVFADQLVNDITTEFRNAKHRAQWKMSLTVYSAPLRPKAVGSISTADVLDVLKPIWNSKPETASRVRGRIERVLDAAKAKGLREGDNPARWRGHLDHLLPKRQKLSRGHHPAMPYDQVPRFMTELHQREAIAAFALEFTILNANRTSEVIGARWPEIDRKARIWTVPAARMKAGREHRVPLGGRSLEILDEMQKIKTSDFVFPGLKKNKPLSEMAMLKLLERLKADDYTVHGFRSSFRDWAGETTEFPREVAEMCLAHVVGDDTELAYRRGDALERRRKLMEAWEEYCLGKTPKKRRTA
jgi:integrase